MSLATALAKARAAQQAANDVARVGTVRINNTDFACSVVRSSIRNELTESGWRRVQTAVVRVRKIALTNVPNDDAVIVMDNLSWFITEIGQVDDTMPAWKLTIKRHLPNPS